MTSSLVAFFLKIRMVVYFSVQKKKEDAPYKIVTIIILFLVMIFT